MSGFAATAPGPRAQRARRPDPATLGWLVRNSGSGWLVTVAVGAAVVVGAATALRPVMGVAAAVAILAGLVVLWRPVLGGYALVALVPVVSGFKRGFPVPQLRLSEALIAGVAAIVLLTATHHQAVPWRPIDWLTLGWAASWCGLGAYDVIALHQRLDTRTLEVLAGPFQFVLLYRAVVTALPTVASRRTAAGLFMWASVPVSLLAIAQQFRVGAIQHLIIRITGGDVFTTYAYHYFARATGPFPHWTPLAGYLLIVLLAGFSMELSGSGPLTSAHLRVVLLLAAAALVLSAELSAIAGTIGGALLLGLWYGRLRRIARWLVIGGCVLAVLFGSYFQSRLDSQFARTTGTSRHALVPQTIDYRLQIWTHQYFPAIGRRPVTGWGPNLPTTISWPFTESQYVTLLMDGGFPVLLLYLGMMWALFERGRAIGGRGSRADPVGRALARAMTVTVVVLLAMNAVFPYFTAGGLPEPFWVVAALVVGSARAGRAQPERGAPARGEEPAPAR